MAAIGLKEGDTIALMLRNEPALMDIMLAARQLGLYFGPLNWVERLAPWLLPRFLKGWERLDGALADSEALREFSNMFLVRTTRA